MNMPSLGDICSGNCLTEIIISNDMFNLESIVYLSIHPTESSGPDGYHPMFSERLEKVLLCHCINLLRNPWKKVKYQLPGKFKMHLLQKLEIKVLHNNVSQLVSVICRMLEHIIKNHLLHYSNQNNFLHLDNMDLSFSLICYPTYSNCGGLHWCIGIESPSECYLPWPTMAFDRVPHARLISKVRSYGVNGKLLQWIEDFLSNRWQQLQVCLRGYFHIGWIYLVEYHKEVCWDPFYFLFMSITFLIQFWVICISLLIIPNFIAPLNLKESVIFHNKTQIMLQTGVGYGWQILILVNVPKVLSLGTQVSIVNTYSISYPDWWTSSID